MGPYRKSEALNSTGADLPQILFSDRDTLCARVDGLDPYLSVPWPFGNHTATGQIGVPHATAVSTMQSHLDEFVPPASGHCVYMTLRYVVGSYDLISDVHQVTAYLYAN